MVVDSCSSDRTVSIGRGFPSVRVIELPSEDQAPQWRGGVAAVVTEWVLKLDADYFVPDELVLEIASLEPSEDLGGYQASFLYAINGLVPA